MQFRLSCEELDGRIVPDATPVAPLVPDSVAVTAPPTMTDQDIENLLASATKLVDQANATLAAPLVLTTPVTVTLDQNVADLLATTASQTSQVNNQNPDPVATNPRLARIKEIGQRLTEIAQQRATIQTKVIFAQGQLSGLKFAVGLLEQQLPALQKELADAQLANNLPLGTLINGQLFQFAQDIAKLKVPIKELEGRLLRYNDQLAALTFEETKLYEELGSILFPISILPDGAIEIAPSPRPVPQP